VLNKGFVDLKEKIYICANMEKMKRNKGKVNNSFKNYFSNWK
jgi:hypothetical protein